MKVKTLVTAVAAALYSAGMAHAAIQQAKVERLEPLKITAEQAKKLNAASTQEVNLLQNDGLNVQISHQNQKFVAEEGLTGEHVYIVRLYQKPLAQAGASLLAQGGAERSAVKAKPGEAKLFVAGQPVNREIKQYRDQLLSKQQAVISELSATLGDRPVRQQFTNAVNGFSMTMSQEEAQRVSQMASVASVRRSKTYDLLSDVGPELIGADKIWTGTVTDSVPYKGENVIVGIIDTGVNTDHRSFADVGDDGYDHQNPWGAGQYVGDCLKEGFEGMCNDKLIGVRSYPVITDNFTSGVYGDTRPAVGEDYQGHGSHVASTAAGNVLLDVDFVNPAPGAVNDGSVVKEALFPRMSGVAPHANIISYQVCHPSNEFNPGCPGEALIAGIEDAISDGVDVINFSIGGQDSHPWSDDVELAFLSAREAGISVAAAAGNSGQPAGYKEYFGAIDHASP